MRRADWLVDVGPDAGEKGGEVLYSGPPEGLRDVKASHTARYLFGATVRLRQGRARPREPRGWLKLEGVTRNNLQGLRCALSAGRADAVTGVSGSGKSSLVSQALVELVCAHLGHEPPTPEKRPTSAQPWRAAHGGGPHRGGMEGIRRLVRVDQKPIGRTPRSNLATYTGLFDHVRKLFAAPGRARKPLRRRPLLVQRGQGPLPTCEGEGFVSVELLFMPSVYAPCPTCHGARYNPQTLKVTLARQDIAEVLGHDGGRGARFLRRRRRHRAAAAAAARHRPGLPAPGPAGHRAVGRRGAAHQAGHRTAAQRSAATRCTCWTSRPPACTRPTWTS
jgi:excinuclease ABC subunit A